MEVIREYTVNELLNDDRVLKNVGQYENGNYDYNKKINHINSYNIQDNIIKLDDHCFQHCSNLSSITIPSSVSYLGNHCFGSCCNLKSITIPNSVSILSDYCFNSCHCLSSITIPDSVSVIGKECFEYCNNLPSITIPDSVSHLSEYCFAHCSILSSITIPNSIIYIGSNCFSDCPNLSSIIIPDSVTYLGKECFDACRNLSSIIIPDSVIYMGNRCFKSCCNLDSITIPEHLLNYLYLYHDLNKNCKIITYKSKPKKVQKEIIEIEPIKINLPQISDDYKPNLFDYNEYIKERSELIETYQNKSVVKYHESVVDIAEDFNENIKVKQLELQEYSRVIQTYSNNLSEISLNLTKKINQHTQKLKEIEENNYKLPELNTIPQFDQIVTPKFKSNSYEIEINLNENYYHKDDLIIPKTNNPYTEIYKLPCKFTEINLTNMKLLSKHEKKIALLPIEYPHEYIDLSNTDIQYFIDTFKNCPNLKEIRYPDSTEYK